MRVFLTGGTGFIGRHLVRSLRSDGHTCVVVSRSGKDPWNDSGVTVVQADPTTPGPWQQHAGSADAVVNLAGEKIVDPPLRWTKRRKARIRRSRVETTALLAETVRESDVAVFASMSAIGYYGHRGQEIVDEEAAPGDDFLGTLAVEWEGAALAAAAESRVVLMRSGLPLAPDGGILEPMLPIFRLGLGGPWGDPKQWLSWIHLEDEIGLIRFLLEHDVAGPVNLTAPNPATVGEFVRELGRSLSRPAVIPTPAFALRLALGESADALLHLQRVVPARALAAGYEFRHPTLAGALAALF